MDPLSTPLLARRRFVATTVAGGAAALALPLGVRQATAQEASRPVTGEFVGAVRPEGAHHEDEIFVAVAADPPASGAEERRVRAYLCDGRSVDEWFVGEVTGNSFTLSSNDEDAEMEVELTDEGVTGSFTLADGDVHDFEATRPTGKGGLYSVYIRDDFSAFGASTRGVAFFNQIVDDQAEGLFLLPNGETVEVTAPVISYPPEGDVACRLIVLDEADSHMRGTSVKTKATGEPLGFWIICLD